MADPDRAGKVQAPQASNLIGDIIGITQLLGGQRQTVTKSPGDIAALQKVIADAEAFDSTKLLESIFNQAQGAIPGISAGYGRTMGRTYGNAQIQTALGELLKQTTLAGQKQVAEQQLANRQLAAQAAQGIAQATTGTTQTSTTKTPLAPAVGGLLLLQALGSLKGNKQGTQQGNVFESLGNTLGGIFSPSSSGGGTGAVAAAAPIMATPSLAATPSVSLAQPGWNVGDTAGSTTPAISFDLGAALSNAFQNPVSTATNLVTAPISAGLNLAGEGIDWLGQQAQDAWKYLFGG